MSKQWVPHGAEHRRGAEAGRGHGNGDVESGEHGQDLRGSPSPAMCASCRRVPGRHRLCWDTGLLLPSLFCLDSERSPGCLHLL